MMGSRPHIDLSCYCYYWFAGGLLLIKLQMGTFNGSKIVTVFCFVLHIDKWFVLWLLMLVYFCTAKPIAAVNEFVAQLQILELLENVSGKFFDLFCEA